MPLALYQFGYKSAATRPKGNDALSRVVLVGSTAAGVRSSVEEA